MAFNGETVLSLLLLLLVLVITPPATADLDYFRALCNETRDYDLCVKLVLGDDRSLDCIDIPCVAKITIDHTLSLSMDSRSFISDQIPSMPPVIVPEYNLCVTAYSTAKEHLDDAIADFAGKNYKGAQDQVKLAGDASDECERRFQTQPTPLTHLNVMFRDTSEVAWDFIKLVIEDQPKD